MRRLQRNYYDLAYPTAFTSPSALKRELKDIPADDIEKWARKQDNITLFKPAREKFKRRPTISMDINSIWSADLASFQSISKCNKGYNYLCLMVDDLSRMVYAFPLKRKTPAEVVEAIKPVFKIAKPTLAFYVDGGAEWKGVFKDYMKKQNIAIWVSLNETKASKAENVIKNFKHRLYKYFDYANTKDWISVYKKIVHNMNHSWHRIIQMRPVDCNSKEQAKLAFIRSYKSSIGFPRAEPDLVTNDQVRMSHLRENFRKRYLQTFSTEKFTIEKRADTENQPIYTVKGEDNDTIRGKIYRKEVTPLQ
jgi:hypothetical protein